MGANAIWAWLGRPLTLAVVLAAGSAAAQEAGAEEPTYLGQEPTDDGSGDVVAWEDGGELPPGFCDDCAETGEFMEEVASAGGSAAAPGADRDDGRPMVMARARRAQGPNICTSPEYYVAWLCEWQGYPRP